MKTNKLEFDELDIKCLSELPLILDVLSSTGNKIGRVLKPMIVDCEKTIKSNLPKDWIVDPNQSYDLLYFPFYNETTNKKIRIETLENSFKVESTFLINKKIDKKEVDYLWIFFGYNFIDTEDDKTDNFYFSIARETKLRGQINTIEFYKALLKNNPNRKIEVEYSENNTGRESVDVLQNEHNVEELQDTYEFFKKNVLIPTLLNIK